MSEKENVEKLSDIRENVIKQIEEYNKLAVKENFHTRLALASSTFDLEGYAYDNEDEGAGSDDRPIDEILEDVGYCPYVGLFYPGARYGWFPSNVNC